VISVTLARISINEGTWLWQSNELQFLEIGSEYSEFQRAVSHPLMMVEEINVKVMATLS